MEISQETIAKINSISSPISDEDYIFLHDEEIRTNGKIWEYVKTELMVSFIMKLIQCFDERYPGNRIQPEEMRWTAPLTKDEIEKRKSNKIPLMSKEEIESIKLPLSDIDYLKLHALIRSGTTFFEYPELDKAYDDLFDDYFYMRYPNSGVSPDDAIWVTPPSITFQRINEIQDPIARKEAIKCFFFWVL